jgi:hypothetical protein
MAELIALNLVWVSEEQWTRHPRNACDKTVCHPSPERKWNHATSLNFMRRAVAAFTASANVALIRRFAVER